MALFAAARAMALDPRKAITQYIHDVWQTQQGLPQNTVGAICQTRDGYLWLGTQEGLVRFDGVRFNVIDKRTSPGLKHNWVIALLEGRDGSLWIGTYGGGLARYRDGELTYVTTAEGLSSNMVFTLREDSEGSLWIGTHGGGCNRLRDGKLTRFTTAEGLSNDWVNVIREGVDGSLWIGTREGLDRLRDGKITHLTTSDGLSAKVVRALHQTRDGSLWIGFYGGGVDRMSAADPPVFTSFTQKDGLGSDRVWTIQGDADGNVWVGTTGGGLHRFRDGVFTPFTTSQGLSNDAVDAIFEDREGSLWIGTRGGGLNRLRDGKLTPLGKKEGLSGDVVFAIHEDAGGRLWIGTHGGGLNRLEDGRLTALTTKDGLPSDSVDALLQSRDGSLWIGTTRGLSRLKDGKLTTFGKEEGLPNDLVRALHQDREGAIWIGTAGGGLARLTPADGKITSYSRQQGLPSLTVNTIAEDRQGRIFVGTHDGLAQFSGGAFTSLPTDGGPPIRHVLCHHEDRDGSLWFGTHGSGLYRLKDGRIARITSADGLFDDVVFAILEDGRGGFWMSCNKGIFRADKRELDAFADGARARVSCVAYGTADGMRSAECNASCQPSGWKARDGRLWFPTIAGAVVLDPDRMPVNQVPPPVLVEELVIDQQPPLLANGRHLEAPAGTEKVELRYTALSFRAPQRVRFRYKLEGFDKDWVEAGTRRTAYYTHLDPGRYTFRVKACNDDGLWNETGASVAFRLQPFFYQTRWFLALCAGVVIAGAAAAHRMRMRGLESRQRELEALVVARTAEVTKGSEELRKAQEQIERLSASAPDLLEDPAAWAQSIAGEIARTVGAREIGVWMIEDDEPVPLAAGATRPPTRERLRQACDTSEIPAASDGDVVSAPDVVVPVLSMTGEARGALVIDAPGVAWRDVDRRLVSGFAHHLGMALDLRQLRARLDAAEERHAASARELHERGIRTLQVCPKCRRCYDDTAPACSADGSGLDESRLLPFKIQGRYSLQRLLGEGGMGSVFAARDERLERDVALKLIRAQSLGDRDARFRLAREAQTVARIHHPSVIALHDSGELEDGSAFLVMELLEGSNLASVLATFGAGSPGQVAALLRQAGAGLAAAHALGVIHRDVKPANLFLSAREGGFVVKLLDFGVARSTQRDARLTRTGLVVGTPAYMSPEQVQGRPLDERSDLYSLAAVGYEALTGRAAARGDDEQSVLMDVLATRPPRVSELLPGVPAAVDVVFARALAKDRASRPPTVDAWVKVVAPLLEALVPPGDARHRQDGGPSGAPLAPRQDGGPIGAPLAPRQDGGPIGTPHPARWPADLTALPATDGPHPSRQVTLQDR